MAPRPFTPAELLTGPFHRRDAYAAGLTDKQLRSPCWRRLFANVHVAASLPLTDEMRFSAVMLAAPPGAVVTGLTAAWLMGVWSPRPGTVLPLELGIRREDRNTSGSRVLTKRIVLDAVDVNEWNGVAISSPERTCFSLMARSSLVEAVVFADAFQHADLVTQRGLFRFADERPHWPHVRKVRVAVDLSRHESRSPGETRLRMVIVLGGLREPPILNGPVYSENGELLGILDFLYFAPDFGIEYDGRYHDEASQHARDNIRENKLLAVGGIPLLRYGAHDVFRNPQRIEREVAAMLGGRSLRRAA
ncbi:MAG TPA: hypothetical protein VMZ00_05070 [Sporichthya sp.]|nr:hypothetical protein [Sporichthya sp.]